MTTPTTDSLETTKTLSGWEVLEYVDIVSAESLGLGPDDDIAPIICAMQEYLDEHEGEALSISVVAARGDEAAGTYLRSANGQLRDDSLSAPDDVRRLTEAAWLAALEAMSKVREDEPEIHGI